MSFEITGKLVAINDTQHVSDRFKKREFVLELAEEINGNVYTNYAKMQLVQNKCEIIDNFKIGDSVKVNFNIKGNKWERDGNVNYITNLDAWRIENAQQQAGAPAATAGSPAYNNPGNNTNSNVNYNPSPESVDDLPF
jgi:hypothetical protein